jgi:hypothetical protein
MAREVLGKRRPLRRDGVVPYLVNGVCERAI